MPPSLRAVPMVALACCIVAPAGRAQEVKTDEARAIAIIRQLHGEVIRDDSRPGKPVIELRLFETDIDDRRLATFERFAYLLGEVSYGR